MTVPPPKGLSFFEQVLRLDFPSFVQQVFLTVSPGDTFLLNWHHNAIAWALEEAELGRNRRLIINLPPRSLKSIIVSVAWVAWLLGHNPKLRIVCISYSGELTLKLARDCRRVLETEWYKRIFPNTRLSRRIAEHDFELTRGGGRFSTSVDGTLTGRGGDLIIVDDPMKASDRYSEPGRKRIIDFFSGTILSRLNDKRRGAIIVLMQRLHEEDLSGHLMSQGGWKHLSLAAIAQENEAIPVGPGEFYQRLAGIPLHPALEDLKALRQLERDMGSTDFSAQYLQQPIPVGGVMVQREWLRTYDKVPEPERGDQIVQSWDTASKEGVLNDYSVCVTALVRKRSVYIIDVYRKKLNFPQLVAVVRSRARQFGANVILVEDAASGTQLIDFLRANPRDGVPNPIKRKPDADKRTRLAGQLARIEAGDLLLPSEVPWLADFLRELLGFPQTKHDDQVDALVHLLGWSGKRDMHQRTVAGPIIIQCEPYDPFIPLY